MLKRMFITEEEEILAEKVIMKIMKKYKVDRETALCHGYHDKMTYNASVILLRVGISPEAVSFLQARYCED